MVMRWTGLGRSTIYRLIAAQQFASPVVLAARTVAWRLTDLERGSPDVLALSIPPMRIGNPMA